VLWNLEFHYHTQKMQPKWTLSWLHNHIMYCKGKVRVHVMKAYKVSSCRALLFLDLETRRMRVNFTPRQAYADTKDQYPRNMRQDRPQSRSGRSEEDGISLTLPEFCFQFDVWLIVHCSSMWNKKPTRCHLVLYLFLLISCSL